MYNHNKAQQSENRVHISWDILYSTELLAQIQLSLYLHVATDYKYWRYKCDFMSTSILVSSIPATNAVAPGFS